MVWCSSSSASSGQIVSTCSPQAPAALQWQEDGELMPDELFQLVQRLRSVEPGHTSNELWRLGHKYPQRRRSTPVGQGQLQHHQPHQR